MAIKKEVHEGTFFCAIAVHLSMLECLQKKIDERAEMKRRAVLYKGDITTALGEQ